MTQQAVPLHSDPATWRGMLQSDIEKFRDDAWESKIFELHETYDFVSVADGSIGVWLVVASPRYESLAEEIRQRAFPRFAIVETKIEKGCYWALLRPSSF